MNEKSLKQKIEGLKQHSISIIKNNSWENEDFSVDCRSYEEGYLAALANIETLLDNPNKQFEELFAGDTDGGV